MEYKVIYQPRAINDLDEITRYISKELYSQESAVQLLHEVEAETSSLDFMPKRYALVSNAKLAKQGFRLIPVRNYLIFYVVNEKEKTVNIISVMYNKRDWGNLL
ncbi:MAG: type II toxin-antitoxin system RelE/ParE family toxin [Defluviitaleaceae bacterium]|nr:type II toxin-antitoxin system RelE/ParE family toxin [Defluviitaleaceae bacterium]